MTTYVRVVEKGVKLIYLKGTYVLDLRCDMTNVVFPGEVPGNNFF